MVSLENIVDIAVYKGLISRLKKLPWAAGGTFRPFLEVFGHIPLLMGPSLFVQTFLIKVLAVVRDKALEAVRVALKKMMTHNSTLRVNNGEGGMVRWVCFRLA